MPEPVDQPVVAADVPSRIVVDRRWRAPCSSDIFALVAAVDGRSTASGGERQALVAAVALAEAVVG